VGIIRSARTILGCQTCGGAVVSKNVKSAAGICCNDTQIGASWKKYEYDNIFNDDQ
jgi:hypothetical protein